jgi:hypothetical protein
MFLALILVSTAAHAADFYVDPEHGDPANAGGDQRPWRSLEEVFDRGLVESRRWDSLPHKPSNRLVPKNPGAPVKAGDTIWLRDGYYGDLAIQGYYNADCITIAAVEGHTPRFRSVRLRSSCHWALKGLHVSAEFGTGKKPRTLVDFESHGWQGPIHDVLIEQCVIRSAEDPGGDVVGPAVV